MEDKRPEVWVARRLMGRGCNCGSYTVAYFASKARVQSVTRRFLKNGQEVKEYEVEYETPAELENLCFDGCCDVYVETGDYVKVGHQVFKNYENVSTYIDLLNDRVETAQISNVPTSMIKETIESSRKEQEFARTLEQYFDKVNHTDSRDNLKIF